MSEPRPTTIFPQGSGLVVVAALALTLLVIGGARLAGFRPDVTLPQVAALDSRILQFEDAAKGVVVVRDATTQSIIKEFRSGEGAFIRATIRALVNDRKKRGIASAGHFRLEAHQGQQLFLIDEATGKALSLNAFGPDNTAAFAAFM